MIRTTTQTITFRRSFFVIGIDEYRPAGTYTVETDEELIEGLTFSAYRRTSARISLPPTPSRPGIAETLTIDPDEIDAALKEQSR